MDLGDVAGRIGQLSVELNELSQLLRDGRALPDEKRNVGAQEAREKAFVDRWAEMQACYAILSSD